MGGLLVETGWFKIINGFFPPFFGKYCQITAEYERGCYLRRLKMNFYFNLGGENNTFKLLFCFASGCLFK